MHHPNHHHHSFHLLHFKINKELKEIYTSLTLRSFALNLIGIFIPIYLYTLGYSIMLILLYFLLYHASKFLFDIFVSGKVAKKVGVKHMMLFSMPLLFVYIVLLSFLNSNGFFLLLVLPFILALSNSLYWVGYHTEFAKFSDKKHRGREVGLMNIFASLSAALGPLLGGVFIVLFNYFALYVFVLIILIFSVVPLFFSKDFKSKKTYSIKRLFKKKSFRKDYVPHIIFGVVGTLFIAVWPLIIHTKGIFEGELGLGFVFTMTFFVGLLLILFATRLADKMKNYLKLSKAGHTVFSFIWLVRGFVSSTGWLFGTEIAAGLTRPFANSTLEKHMYGRSVKSRNILEYTVFREASLHFFGTLTIALIMIVGYINLAPFLSAVAHLLIWFI